MYQRRRIEGDTPVEGLYQLALREGNSKKPVYEMHKWWARRLGGVFRMLLLLATAPDEQTDDDVWRRFYGGDDLSSVRVLDPFMGGGTSIVEATKLGCQTVGVDIDPVAWYVARQEISACDLPALERLLQDLQESDVVARIRSLYQTTIPATRQESDSIGGDATMEADVVYNFWVDELACPGCGHTFEAHNHYKLLYHPSKKEQTVFCRTCHEPAVIPTSQPSLRCAACEETTQVDAGPIARGNYACPACGVRGRVVDLTPADHPLPKRWFAIEYMVPGTDKRRFKRPDTSDFARYQLAEEIFGRAHDAPTAPRRPIPTDGRTDLRPTTHGYTSYHHLFNTRQLLCLGWLHDWIAALPDTSSRDYAMLAFSDALASNNLLCSFAYGYDKLTPLFGLHAYNMITRPVENNVWGTRFGRGSYLKCLRKVIDGKRYCAQPYESRYDSPNSELEKVYTGMPIAARIAPTGEAWYRAQEKVQQGQPTSLLLNRPSQDLSEIHPGTIDIILSDPPYYNNLSYSELADFYYAWTRPYLEQVGATWCGPTTPFRDALFVDAQPSRARTSVASFTEGLCAVFRECQRVLKDDGLFIFTFHHLDAQAWAPVVLALREGGLRVVNVFPVRSEGRSAFHSSDGSIKWDAVLVCRKGIAPTPAALCSGGAGCDDDATREAIVVASRTATEAWIRRLSASGIALGWPDAVSLTFAHAARHIAALPIGRDESIDVNGHLHYLSERIIDALPHAAARRMRQRKGHERDQKTVVDGVGVVDGNTDYGA